MNRVHVDAQSKAAQALAPLVRRRARALMRALELDGCELSVSLVSDARIRALNKTWRKKDKATDVLSFALEKKGSDPFFVSVRHLGDIVISTDTARRQAKEWKRTVPQEVERYLAHGLLHLLGYDHHRAKDRVKMAAAEERLLSAPGMLGPA